MTEFMRLKVNWAGISGGTGVSTFSVERTGAGAHTVTDLNNAFTRLRLLFENTSEWLPNDVTLSFPATVDLIESTTGDISGQLTASVPASNVPGALTTAWQNGVGSRIVWNTGVILGKKRQRGVTYLVPYGGIFDTDGTLSSAAVSDLLGAATALLSGLNTDSLRLRVFSPKFHALSTVASATVSDKAVVLRSRRD